jgi:hypothetical protein
MVAVGNFHGPYRDKELAVEKSYRARKTIALF